MQVGVTCYLVGWYRINIVVWINTYSIFLTTLEAPEILAACEETETNEVATTASFEIELTTPLVEDVVEVDRLCEVYSVGTILQLLDILQRTLLVAETIESLSTCEVDFAKTEEWNVCITEVVSMSGSTVGTHVRPFHDRESVEEVLDSLVW